MKASRPSPSRRTRGKAESRTPVPLDVVSINRFYGWYAMGARLEQAVPVLEKELAGLHQSLGKPIIVTAETGHLRACTHLHAASCAGWREAADM